PRHPNVRTATISNREQRRTGNRRLKLPGLPGIRAVNDASLIADYQHVVTITYCHCKQVATKPAFEIFPRRAAVVGAQDDPARAHDVTSLRVSESDRVQPLFQIAIDTFPVLTAILGARERPAVTDCDAVIRIEKLHVLEPVQYVCLL